MEANTKNPKIKIFLITFLAIMSVAFTFSTVYAAYYGRGVFKDVFVNRKYYFSSDCLKDSKTIEDAKDFEITMSTSIFNINVFNYNLSTGDYDDFDITFDVYAWLSNTNESYNLRVGSESFNIDSEDHANPITTGIFLEKNRQSTSTISLNFGLEKIENIEEAPKLYLAAVATSPSYIEGKVLSATFEMVRSEEYNVQCYLDYDSEAPSTDFAGFKYIISMDGESTNDSKIKISWNSSALTLIKYNNTTLMNVEYNDIEDGSFDKSITFDCVSNFQSYLTFYRTEVGEEESSYWVNESTWENQWKTIEGLIKFEIINETI